MQMTPAQVRAMTPEETGLIVSGWNQAQSGSVAAPTDEEFEALVERYG